MSAPDEALKLEIAPTIVEDLGLNLYTDLPRVLVEFIANAYDADAKKVAISMDIGSIDRERKDLRQKHRDGELVIKGSLAQHELDDRLTIIIRDDGFGMSRDDLKSKFLVVGRRRRQEASPSPNHTPNGRAVMGRKGLGKLAGFGIGKRVELTTRASGEEHSTRITLDYDLLRAARQANSVAIEEERLTLETGGLESPGTRLAISRLLFEPVKSREETIIAEVSKHFAAIDPTDFLIEFNHSPVAPPRYQYDYNWPNPDVPQAEYVTATLEPEDCEPFEIKYRLRFRKRKEHLPAGERGVRIYSRKRLTAAASLLDAPTGMHGFRNTDYLEGVCHADFIDDQEIDYIATDRQSIRWDVPQLAEMKRFLSSEIAAACNEYQKSLEAAAPNRVDNHEVTKEIFERASLSGSDKRFARRVAVMLAKSLDGGVDDPAYETTLRPIVQGIGTGSILTSLNEIAQSNEPEFASILKQLTLLAADEYDRFMCIVKARLKGIEALEKIVSQERFAESRRERSAQDLFEGSPWLLDPTYHSFLTANRTNKKFHEELSRELAIDESTNEGNSERPDVTFILGSDTLKRIVIVELKAANKPLEAEDLTQLEAYMEDAHTHLVNAYGADFRIEGQLIGTIKRDPTTKGQKALARRLRTRSPEELWCVRDYSRVLTDAREAHTEWLSAADEVAELREREEHAEASQQELSDQPQG